MPTAWEQNAAGNWVRTVQVNGHAVFIVLIRTRERAWKWAGYGNGKPLGYFDGLADAKRRAPQYARELT